MRVVSQTDTNATLTGGHRFVINLITRKGSSFEVRSCEVIGPHHRNRFTFPNKVTLGEVFVDDLAQGLNQCLSSLSDKTEVVSLPSVAIEIPGLSLARVNLITTKSDDGSLAVILRFKLLLGGVARAFRPSLGIEDSVPNYASHMSASVLTDIVLPLLNLCEAAENDALRSIHEVGTFMDTLIDRAREVRFHAELIKRFVAGSAMPDAEPRLNNPDRPRIELVKSH